MVHHESVFKDALDIGPFPALLCAAEDPAEKPAPLGLIALFHGLGGAKEDCIDDLDRFARAGFAALAVDAPAHGARWSEQLQDRLDDPALHEQTFAELVDRAAREVPTLIDELETRGWLESSRVGLVGYSFGGFVALAARLHDARVAVAVSIAGSPRWERRSEMSPAENVDSYWPTALLLMHGEQDEVVAPEPGARFISALRPHYAAAPARLERVTYSEAGHLFPHQVWERTMVRAVDFCTRFLPPS